MNPSTAMSYLLALDQGTTSSRAIVFDLEGRPVASAQQEFAQHYPQPGWVEHDPVEIWASQLHTAREALSRAGIGARDVVAIGITNQRETTVLWERATGRPVANAIVWQDRRTAPICDELKSKGVEPTVRSKTGLVLDPYFSGTKLKWLLDNTPGLRRRAERGELATGTIDAWLIYNLTEGRLHATDVSNASRTLMFNINTLNWDEELLGILDVPASVLPEVHSSSGVYGETSTGVFDTAVPIAGVAGDQQAALFGQACFREGMAKNTYGTGCFMLMHTGTKPVVSRAGLLSTVAWQLDRHAAEYALEGSVFIAGAVVQWLRDGLGVITESSEVEALAASARDTGGLYLVPAFVGLGAPYWDPYARGILAGITRGTTRAQIARAALESIAYQTREVLDAMERDSGLNLQELRVDGGAAQNNLLLQFQADIMNVPVVRPSVTETTAMGAAYLAGIGAGVLSMEEISRRWTVERRFHPQMDPEARARLYGGWKRAVQLALNWSKPEEPDNATTGQRDT